MKDNFEKSLQLVLHHEGGYSNHPADPGGATNQGITQRTYSNYLRKHKRLEKSVKDITPAERDEIYRDQYWNKISGDYLPIGVDYVVFDGAVNSGPSQSIKWLQRSLGDKYDGSIDGIIGDMTISAVHRYVDRVGLIEKICACRWEFMKSLKTFSEFRHGWSARVHDVEFYAKQMSKGDVPVVNIDRGTAPKKARIDDAKKIPTTGLADGLIGAGASATTGLTIFDEARKSLLPYADSSQFIQKMIVALTIISVGVVVFGVVYRAINKRKANTLISNLNIGT